MAHGGVRVVAIPSSSGIVRQIAGANPEWDQFFGFSGEETGGSNGKTVVFREGTSTGTILAVLNVAASGVASLWLGPQGVRAAGGIYAVVSGSGTLAGSVYVG